VHSYTGVNGQVYAEAIDADEDEANRNQLY